ncbi:SHOCT domain-containing protein [Streptomyces sp. NBC_00237]|uniref:SHOCT domain-containing protein n=1 Tax=Streptomyces sp. NBC_00237 TaxID=2975687 RepID=UPI00225BA3A9|nr:SHOCT domain-containing protein [Streptomyces sp. NBC_00237]MCX5207100.1 SHOCT domain-containing protein [Streptomyces sp. NBC_00237]
MNTLAHEGPGPWLLFVPLVWAAVVFGVVTLLRRTVWRGRGRGPGRGGPWQGHGRAGQERGHGEQSPITVLGRRFATGEIDEDEYWRRLSVLNEQFGRTEEPLRGKGGMA